jgi:hypothetical protein
MRRQPFGEATQMNMRALLLLSLFTGVLLHAQTTGVIKGTLRDSSGGVLASGQVRVVQGETGAQRELAVDAKGYYQVLELSPGTYRVEASAAGFQSSAREGLSLSAGRTLSVDFTLPVGINQQEIIVTADAALVSIAASDWGGLVESEKLADLPLNGRDLFELSVLEPGATTPTSARRSLAQGIGGQISVNGSRPTQNAYQIDGVYVNDAKLASVGELASSLSAPGSRLPAAFQRFGQLAGPGNRSRDPHGDQSVYRRRRQDLRRTFYGCFKKRRQRLPRLALRIPAQ